MSGAHPALSVRCQTGMSDRRWDPGRTERLNRLKQEIADRLRRVCQEWPAEEFDVLVTRAAEIDIKYRMRTRREVLGE